MKKNLSLAGQSLVEMVVVIGVVVALAVGIVAGTTAVLGSTQTTQIRSNAAKYAAEGIERARQIRDASWNTFAQMGATASLYCLGEDGQFVETGTTCSGKNIGGVYTRGVTLELLPAGPSNPVEKMSVRVEVSWGPAGVPGNSMVLETYLTEWR